MTHLRAHRRGFTLIELLASIAIISLLIGILIPFLSKSRAQAKTTVCQSRLKNLGSGMVMYAGENSDYLMPGRMPRVDNARYSVGIEGGVKYRPTFIAMMGSQVGVAPFSDPMPDKGNNGRRKDRFEELADRQNYDNDAYLCPVVSDWTDERNAAYGYNYQFLGNGRLLDEGDERSFKNWPVAYSRVKNPARCVAVGDSMGTAATFGRRDRNEYENNGRDVHAYGDEGFNLDPPLVDPSRGEMAGFAEDVSEAVRTALHERHHNDQANVLWIDGHVTPETNKSVGYEVSENGAITFGIDRPPLEGGTSNRLWTVRGTDGAWIRPDAE